MTENVRHHTKDVIPRRAKHGKNNDGRAFARPSYLLRYGPFLQHNTATESGWQKPALHCDPLDRLLQFFECTHLDLAHALTADIVDL